jgi:hypothetical protein
MTPNCAVGVLEVNSRKMLCAAGARRVVTRSERGVSPAVVTIDAVGFGETAARLVGEPSGTAKGQRRLDCRVRTIRAVIARVSVAAIAGDAWQNDVTTHELPVDLGEGVLHVCQHSDQLARIQGVRDRLREVHKAAGRCLQGVRHRQLSSLLISWHHDTSPGSVGPVSGARPAPCEVAPR